MQQRRGRRHLAGRTAAGAGSGWQLRALLCGAVARESAACPPRLPFTLPLLPLTATALCTHSPAPKHTTRPLTRRTIIYLLSKILLLPVILLLLPLIASLRSKQLVTAA